MADLFEVALEVGMEVEIVCCFWFSSQETDVCGQRNYPIEKNLSYMFLNILKQKYCLNSPSSCVWRPDVMFFLF